MATFLAEAACGMPGGGSNQPDEAGGTMIRAADKYSRELRARAPDPARPARQPVPHRWGCPTGRDALPAGYFPLDEVKDLSLLGRWPLLEDGMSACMPTRMVSAMQERSSLGDREAASWLEMHSLACAGAPEAQRAFGTVCENGSYRSTADVQRAFFWYYRAGLKGDAEARRNAERLMHQAQRISPQTMSEPVLIYPGRWQIVAHLSPQLVSASEFELLEDGTASGFLLGNSRAAAGSSATPEPAAHAADDDGSEPSPLPRTRYRGGWAFDNIGQILTIIFESEEERRWRAANWQIEIIGCKPGSLFGRDRRMVGYTLERLSGAEQSEL